MTVQILTPEKMLFDGEVSALTVPGISGSLGILNRHAPMITALNPGTVKLTLTDQTTDEFEVKGGMLEVQNNHVILLAE